MKYDQAIQFKKFIVESLIPFNKELNDAHDKEYLFTGWAGRKECDNWIDMLKKVQEEWKKCGYRSDVLLVKENSGRLLKLFRAIKSCLIDNPELKIHLAFV